MVEDVLWGVVEVARYLGLNEKIVYRFIKERGLPATKVTGKWLFSKRHIDEWLENSMCCSKKVSSSGGIILFACSDDPLLSLSISKLFGVDNLFFFCANVGSGGAVKMLSARQVQAAGAHLIEPHSGDYNLPYLSSIIDEVVVVTFAERTQGILLPEGNPDSITNLWDIVERRISLLTRQQSSGTRTLLESIFRREGISPDSVKFVEPGAMSHFEIGFRVHSGGARAGFSIEAIARVFGLYFIPVHRERYDLILFKNQMRHPQVKSILSFINSAEFEDIAAKLGGYDCKLTGKLMVG